jgi:hypothetical protein
MEKRALAFARRSRRLAWPRFDPVPACTALPCAASPQAAAGTQSAQELQIVGRAVTFMQPRPAGGTVAVVYAAGDTASRQDADAIAGDLGQQVGTVLLPVKEVEASMLAKGGFAVAITAAGANGPALADAVRDRRILCVAAAQAAVEAGFCTMGVTAKPRVEVVLNHAAAAAASDITFVAAFRMMIHEM